MERLSHANQKQHSWSNLCNSISKHMHIKCRQGDRKDKSKRTTETPWPVTDVPPAYSNTRVRAGAELSGFKNGMFSNTCSSEPKSPHIPPCFNGSGGASIRASGLGDECVNNYSLGVGSSPPEVDYTHCSPRLSISFCRSFFSADPTLSSDLCAAPLSETCCIGLFWYVVCNRATSEL